MRISCIIPTLGRGRILRDTIQMLRDQSLEPDEIIVVDQTPLPDAETAAELAKWDGNGQIIWLRQSEPNASRARNVGASVSTGDIAIFLDDDIRIDRDFIERYRQAFSPGVVAVAGQIIEVGSESHAPEPLKDSSGEMAWLFFPKNYTKKCETSWFGAGNFAVRRSVFFEVGGMDENYDRGAFREESDFGMRFSRAGYRFVFEPRASITHLGSLLAPNGGSRTWTKNKRIAGWHHCIGDWYFTFGFASARNWHALFTASMRHFVFNRYNLTHPWLVPILFLRWLAAMPIAAARRLKGARLINRELARQC